METFLFIGIAFVVLYLWFGKKISNQQDSILNHEDRIHSLQAELRVLRRELHELREEIRQTVPLSAPPESKPLFRPIPAPAPTPAPAPVVPPVPVAAPRPVFAPPAPPLAVPPLLPTQPEPEVEDAAEPLSEPAIPPVAPPVFQGPRETQPEPEPTVRWPKFDWEQLLGVKLFAWIGGFTLFLGLILFLKYAFEKDLISPPLQVGGEYLVALGILIGGLWLTRKDVAVLAQTLCATGVVALYSVTFAMHTYYGLTEAIPTFAVMAVITAAAFVLAVRLDAPVVAILGLVGGFLTPVMIRTGKDNPFGLFSYIALLDIGLILVALRKRWTYLVAMGVIGTTLLEMAWVIKFFSPEKAMIALTVFVGFEALFVVAFVLARKRGQVDQWLNLAGVAGAILPLWFMLYLFADSKAADIAGQVGFFFALLLALNIGIIFMARLTRWAPLVPAAAMVTMILMMMWMTNFFAGPKLWSMLTVVLGFEILFLGVYALSKRESEGDPWNAGGAAGMALMPFWFAYYLLSHGHVEARTWLYFTLVLAADLGLFAVVWRTGWGGLTTVAAAGTILLEIAWIDRIFTPDHAPLAMSLLLGFDGLFLLLFVAVEKWRKGDIWVAASAIGMAFVPVGFALYLQKFPAIASGQPALYFGYLLLADILFAVIAVRRLSLAHVQAAGGGAVFFVLSIWTGRFLNAALLNWALGVILLFGVLHAVFPVVLKRLRPDAVGTRWWQLFPLLALGLVLFPILRLPDVPWAVWICVLALDAVLFVLAVMSAAVMAMIGAIVLTVVVAASWIFRMPVEVPPLTGLIFVVGGFSLFFFGISFWAARRLRLSGETPSMPAWLPIPLNLEAQLPAMGAVLPFMLLMLATGRLTLSSSSPIFGLALLLVVLLLAVVRLTGTDLLAAIALGCTFLLELVWQGRSFTLTESNAVVPLLWHVAFYAVFLVFPFLFLERMRSRVLPWVVAALVGPMQFSLIYRLVKVAWPGLQPYLGIVPALFVLPSLACLAILIRKVPADEPRRLSLLAWFGGVTLFFITLIFPVQFDRQWLTISWALEGAALLWLFHRVPHPGLPYVGLALLVTAFARLGLNPAVLSYHARSETAILNWYLYSYGLVTASLFAGGRLTAPPRNLVQGANVPPLLYTLGTILAFLLMNIEIADFFTAPGASVLTFEFSANFGRDMTYSIAWALFALTLLTAGIARKLRMVRYASLGLLVVTLLKLFLHDFANLQQLYRIGAFVGVAMVLLVASFLYQKFVRPDKKTA